MKKTEIKAIAFDIGGVLEFSKWYYQKMCKDLGINFNEFLNEATKYTVGFKEGVKNAKQLVSIFGKKFNINPNHLLKKWIYYAQRASSKNLELEKIIKRLKKNYKVVTLTNISKVHNIVRKKKNMYKHFHFNICSCDVGLAKPDPRIYKLLIKKLKLKPEEIIFVDDIKKMLSPAKKLGIKTIHFKNANQLKKELIKFGVKLK